MKYVRWECTELIEVRNQFDLFNYNPKARVRMSHGPWSRDDCDL